MPYVLNSPLGIDLELNIFKKDSLFSTAQQSIQLFYNLSSMQKISGGIKKIESSNLSSNTEFNTTDYSTQLFEALYLFEKRQNRDLLFPIKQQLKLIYSNGQRTSNSLKTPQEIILLKAQNIFKINKKNSLFLGFQAEQIRSDNLQFNELRRFGGIQSLRGFEENSLYASSYALLNTEYRFRINNSFYLHTIADIAFMEDNNLESKKLYGFGLGFGIRTNAGLFNINYANGSTNQQDFDFAKSKVHISLKTTF
jgi:hemolysin activation/secretion protein